MHGDKGYDLGVKRQALRAGGIVLRLARRGIESKARLGRHREVVEHGLWWLNWFGRRKIRYERDAEVHLALLELGCGCALICWRFLEHGFVRRSKCEYGEQHAGFIAQTIVQELGVPVVGPEQNASFGRG